MQMQELMRPSVSDDWGLKGLQNCLLNVMKYIHDFCEDNGIEYCIMGGTALGAIRHGGFIPWDDDIDIFMDLSNYQKFRKLFYERGDKENYYLQEMGKSGSMVDAAKLRLNCSEFIEDVVADQDIHHGVFIDIMLLRDFPANKFSQKWMVFWQTYIQLKSLSNRNYTKRGGVVHFLLKLMRITPKRFLLNFALKQMYRYEGCVSENYFHYYISAPLHHSVYPKELFKSYLLVDFETIKLRVPVGVKEYLAILFGDYMKIPDLKQIRFHQHTTQWSPDRSFVPRGKGTFEDEKYYW